MPKSAWQWTLNHRIPSERGAGQEIIEVVLARLEDEGWTSHDVFSVRLALEEVIVNAIKHGNRLDHSKQVRVVCKLSAERLWIEITDEGTGFKPENVPDCTDPARLEIPCGRGILLMRSYMDRVEYNKEGNTVVMEKTRDQE